MAISSITARKKYSDWYRMLMNLLFTSTDTNVMHRNNPAIKATPYNKIPSTANRFTVSKIVRLLINF
jgi:hypothetical protein